MQSTSVSPTWRRRGVTCTRDASTWAQWGLSATRRRKTHGDVHPTWQPRANSRIWRKKCLTDKPRDSWVASKMYTDPEAHAMAIFRKKLVHPLLRRAPISRSVTHKSFAHWSLALNALFWLSICATDLAIGAPHVKVYIVIAKSPYSLRRQSLGRIGELNISLRCMETQNNNMHVMWQRAMTLNGIAQNSTQLCSFHFGKTIIGFVVESLPWDCLFEAPEGGCRRKKGAEG